MATTNNTTSTTSTPSFSYLQYKNKIGGLVSGMDIDSIMEKLMKAENAQKEKLQQQKQKYEWQRDAYREVNTKLKTFEENSLTSYGLQSSWNAKTVTVSNSAVSATATASANGTLNIEAATLATAGKKTMDLGTVNTVGRLSDLGLSNANGKFNFSIDGGDVKTIEYSKDDSLDIVVEKLNNTEAFEASIIDGKLNIKVKDGKTVTIASSEDSNSKQFAEKLGFTIDGTTNTLSNIATEQVVSGNGVKSNSTLASMGLKDGSFKIKAVNEKGEYTTKEISYKATDTISEVMNRINASGVGVTAIVGESKDTNGNIVSKISLTANVEGEGDPTIGSMSIEQDDNGLFKQLGLLSSETGDLTDGAGGAKGTNGSITVNGVEISGTSNKYSISGYNLTINETITTPTKISSTVETDKIVDKVKEFVKTYNELIADLSARTTEKKNVSYTPLTDAQKSEMTTDQITKWEDLAKKGLLKGDSTLNSVISNMRQTLSGYGTYTLGGTDGKEKIYTKDPTDVLYKIGITTSSTWSDGGKLEIDEDKLKQALSDDPDIVARIFAGDSANGKEGIISEIRKTAKDAVAIIKDKAGSESAADSTYSLGKNISSLTTKIDDWTDRLKDIEERYWNQFSAMEKAIQKANSQTSIFDSY